MNDIVQFLKARFPVAPDIGVICGSGLSELHTILEDTHTIEYEDIPGFPGQEHCPLDAAESNDDHRRQHGLCETRHRMCTVWIRVLSRAVCAASTVQGHANQMVFGKLGGKNVVLMRGRFHFYEGYEMSKGTAPPLHERSPFAVLHLA